MFQRVSSSSAVLVVMLLVSVVSAPGCGPAPPATPEEISPEVAAPIDTRSALSGARTNIVLILTDDQRWDTVESMPYLEQLANEGVRFDNAMVTTPACMPSRASLLAGGFYAAETGVLANAGPNAEMARFRDETSLASTLVGAGYATGFVGKYLNNYLRMSRSMLRDDGIRLDDTESYIPPGWSSFASTTTRENREDDPWHRFLLSRGSSESGWSTGSRGQVEGYVETVHRDLALEFLAEQTAERPFFLMVSTHAPHAPAIPEPEDADRFTDFVYRDRGYGEGDVEDKPGWIPRSHDEWQGQQAERDDFHRDQLRTLQSVDRLTRAIVENLQERNLADDTLVLFASDNGQMWGEHRDFGKNKAFEESIRVPLIAWRPGMTAARFPHLAAVNLDVAATILDVAGVDTSLSTTTSGLSLGRFLVNDAPAAWRSHLVLESYADPAWLGIRTLQVEDGAVTLSRKYVEYYSGDREFYDLAEDVLELESRHDVPVDEPLRARMRALLPDRRGPVIVRPVRARDGAVGQHWELVPEACCDTLGLTWEIADGRLPRGLNVDTATGVVSGVPTEAGRYRFVLRVSADVDAVPGRPGDFAREYVVRIGE